MRIVSIQKDERVFLGPNIYLSIGRTKNHGIEIIIDAPKNISVHREECLEFVTKKKNLENLWKEDQESKKFSKSLF